MNVLDPYNDVTCKIKQYFFSMENALMQLPPYIILANWNVLWYLWLKQTAVFLHPSDVIVSRHSSSSLSLPPYSIPLWRESWEPVKGRSELAIDQTELGITRSSLARPNTISWVDRGRREERLRGNEAVLERCALEPVLLIEIYRYTLSDGLQHLWTQKNNGYSALTGWGFSNNEVSAQIYMYE